MMQWNPQQMEERINKRQERIEKTIKGINAAKAASPLDMEEDMTIRSRGEYFFPYVMAALEACWFYAATIGLAGLDFLSADHPLVPIWGVLLVLCLVIWLFRRMLLSESKQTGAGDDDGTEGSSNPLRLPGLRPLFGALAVFAVVLVWLQIYSSTAALYDPGWLLAFVNDLLLFNTHLAQVIALLMSLVFLCWRGMRLAQIQVEPGRVFRYLWMGMATILVAILMRSGRPSAGSTGDDVVLLLLVPVYLYLALSAHALARAAWVRRDHATGLHGSVDAQEKSMLSIIGGVGVALLILTLLGGSAFSPAFFDGTKPFWNVVGAGYGWLSNILARVLVWISTPFFWLFQAWFNNHAPAFHINTNVGICRTPTGIPNPPPVPKNCGLHPATQVPQTVTVLTYVARFLVPVLIFLGLFVLILMVLRRRKKMRLALNRKGSETHESIWSWNLFWGQVRALFWALFGRLFPKRAASEVGQREEEIKAIPAVRTVREMYRALLKKAAARGQIRKRDETPHEFQWRLDQRDPQNEPQLGALTDAYALTRYGGGVPSEHELETLHRLWNELEQKWETVPQ